jgi:hypothetical protein
MSDGGKGSKRRPQQISDEELQKRWDEAFERPIGSKIKGWDETRIDIIGSNGNGGDHYKTTVDLDKLAAKVYNEAPYKLSLDEIYTKIEKDYNEGN